MRLHEQRDRLVQAIELVFPELGGGPTLSHYSVARDDCALVHIDYFAGIEMARMELANALEETTGEPAPEIHKRLRRFPEQLCDCRSCVGAEAAAEAERKAREAYTYVKEWSAPIPAERSGASNPESVAVPRGRNPEGEEG